MMGPSVGVTRYKGDWELPEGGGTWAPPGGPRGPPGSSPGGAQLGAPGDAPEGFQAPWELPIFVPPMGLVALWRGEGSMRRSRPQGRQAVQRETLHGQLLAR